MSAKIITVRNEGWSWQCRKDIYAKGYLFDNSETLCRGEDLIDYFSEISTIKHFTSRLTEANGSFAVVLETESHVLAAVDPVRSMPLFYTIQKDNLLIGDDVRKMQDQLGGREIDPIAKEEFLRFGYTVGPSTLDPRIKQIEAGELFVYDKSSAQSSTSIYFSHAHGDYTEKDEKELIEELDQITTRWTQRLIKSAQGRTIVVPLSGGYDSRYIVCALKRANYQNVICYSYGFPESYEHQIASKVAARLEYPLHVIGYSDQSWKMLLESPRFHEYCRFAFQQDAVPCIQELLAREMLLKMEVLPSDSILVPGYCGDVQGGSFVPHEVLNRKSKHILGEGIDQYILRDYFSLRTSQVSSGIKQAVLAEIHKYTSLFRMDDIQVFCSVLEAWLTRERLAKFVVNTVRTHELYGNEWRLPLWDNELISWWYRIPLEHRINSVLFHKFLFERIFAPAGVEFRKPRSRGQLNRLAQTWLPDRIIPFVRALYKKTVKQIFNRSASIPIDLGGFNYVSEFLLKQLSSDCCIEDFGNINGIVATWCMQHTLTAPDSERTVSNEN